MQIRPISPGDVSGLYHMLCRLDEETEYMMYEPGERQSRTNGLNQLDTAVQEATSGSDFLLVAENEVGEIVGFLWAERGKLNRVLHTAYIVVGIRSAYRRMGIGTRFFKRLESWARECGIVRLELTVECPNTEAIHLYEKSGFKIEGTRPRSMKVNDEYVDEYYMGRILNY